MSDLTPVPAQDDDDRRLRGAWWIWPILALFLIGAALGTSAGVGGFSGSTAAPQHHHHGNSPAGAPSGGSSSGSGLGSGNTSGPVVAAGGGGGLPTGALLGIPPAPVITAEPTNPTNSTSAHFAYSDAVLLTSFRCSLDGAGYSQCGAVINLPSVGAVAYTNVLPGAHCFSVEGVTALLLVSVPTTYCWQQNGVGFTIGWTAPAKFYPGTSQSANLVIDNPNGKAITIAAGGITVTVLSDDPTACPSSNFAVTQGLMSSVTIPANTTETIGAAGAASSSWPVITMYDGVNGPSSHTNQDACEGVGLTFTFSGSATGT